MATLFERQYEEFVPMVLTATADGEGGQTTAWVAGTAFLAVAVFESSTEKNTGAEAGTSSTYTITVPKTVTLTYHDVIKRTSDEKIFRITSDGDDVVTPTMATFSFIKVKAEEWELPNGGAQPETGTQTGGGGNA